MNMESEFLSEMHDESRFELKAQQKTIEELQQQLHEAKSNLLRSELMKGEMEAEIDRFQMKFKNIDTERIEELQRKETQLTTQWGDRVNALQLVIDEERELHKEVIIELEHKISKLATTDQNCVNIEQTDELLENISFLTRSLEGLKDKLSETQILLEKSQFEKAQLREKLKCLEQNLEETKEMLKDKNESLQAAVSALQDIQEEKALLSSELATLKAGPIGELHRGNSLFAEVDDKRQSSETKLETIRSKYIHLKKMVTLKTNENNKLKTENIRLRRYWQEDEKSSLLKFNNLKESYRQRIDDLIKQVEALEQRPESPKIITISDKNLSQLQWVHTVIENTRAEARELRNELQEKSAQRMIDADQLYLAQQEVRNLKAKAMKDEGLIEELKMELAANRNSENESILPNNGVSEVETQKSQETQQSSRVIRFADDVKENDGDTKKRELKRIPNITPFNKVIISSNKENTLQDMCCDNVEEN